MFIIYFLFYFLFYNHFPIYVHNDNLNYPIIVLHKGHVKHFTISSENL
jgi:hypothetical protein